MRAISMWQPWASLLIDGRKKIETRSWPAPKWLVGVPLAIHATKGNFNREFSEECGYQYPEVEVPLGAMIGIVRIDKCERFTDEFYRLISLYPESKYGDFYPGRWGWFVTVLEKFSAPYPQRGKQGIFEWERPLAEGNHD